MRKEVVTPKRPDATCLMADDATSPVLRPLRCGKVVGVTVGVRGDGFEALRVLATLARVGLLPPMRFIAMAIASWHSREMAPRDMPPVQNRAQMSPTDSTSSMSMGFLSLSIMSMSRREVAGLSLRSSW